jgi:hypothetical protein
MVLPLLNVPSTPCRSGQGRRTRVPSRLLCRRPPWSPSHVQRSHD